MLQRKPDMPHLKQGTCDFIFHKEMPVKKKKKECILRACLFLVCTLHLKSQPSLRGKQQKELYICGIIHSFPC